MIDRQLTPVQRAALVGWWLASGQRLRVADLVQQFGLSRQAVYDLLDMLAIVLPIDAVDGWWTRCE